MPSQESQEKLDAALDAALDDLDDDDEDDDDEVQQQESKLPAKAAADPQQKGPTKKPPQTQQYPAPQQSDPSLDDMMKQLLQMGPSDADDEFMGRFLQEMQSQIGAEFGKMEEPMTQATGKKEAKRPSPEKQKSNNSKKVDQQSTTANDKKQSSSGDENNNEVDQAISSLIEGMSKQSSLDEDTGAGDDNQGEDDMFKNLMGQLGEGFGDDANADALIDGMMEQLLSKELMYEPMKKVAEKFPDWLEQNKGKLPEAEYEERCKQYKCFQKLVHVYDSEPENTQTLMLLMQEVQEFGQPPPEIIKDIAPGLELDEDGLPKMDGANGGMPFPAGGDEDCRIM